MSSYFFSAFCAALGASSPGRSQGLSAIDLVQGDTITIDAEKRLLQLNVSDSELARRRAQWRPPAQRYTRGVLAKYAKLVSSSSRGAVTD